MRQRLAWFSPLPPVRSGIAAYTTELLPLVGATYDIDVFVDRPPATEGRPGGPPAGGGRPALAAPPPGAAGVFSAHEFLPRHAHAPYSLVVYQLGNAACHDYMWPYLVRYPGLVVLHDAVLHHSRARTLLARGRKDDYRAEFRFAHPRADPHLVEFAVAGLEGAPYYLWSLSKVATRAARLVAVHSTALAALLSEDDPEIRIRRVRMGVRPVPDLESRREPGPVFACYGLVTPEKRISQVLRAFAAVRPTTPHAQLLLVGPTVDHYDVRAEVQQLGLDAQVTITGYVPDEDLDIWLGRADVCLCLRWPTARETSASWLRCLAAGKPTVITDLLQTTDVPTLDPRTWTLAHTARDARAANAPPDARDAVAVAVDILDEDHSLGLALRRLASDEGLRARLGHRARAWWASHHTLEHMARDYEEAIAEAMTLPLPSPPRDWPAHLREDGTGLARRLAEDLGVRIDLFPSP